MLFSIFDKENKHSFKRSDLRRWIWYVVSSPRRDIISLSNKTRRFVRLEGLRSRIMERGVEVRKSARIKGRVSM